MCAGEGLGWGLRLWVLGVGVVGVWGFGVAGVGFRAYRDSREANVGEEKGPGGRYQRLEHPYTIHPETLHFKPKKRH